MKKYTIILWLLSIAQLGFSQTAEIAIKVDSDRKIERVIFLMDGKRDTLISSKNNKLSFRINNRTWGRSQLTVKYINVKASDNIQIYTSPGRIFVDIIHQGNVTVTKISGNVLAKIYEMELWGPVKKLNEVVSAQQLLLNKAVTDFSGDTTELRKKIKSNVKQCYNVPRQFVLKNRSSPLCIPALEMMGMGDPSFTDERDRYFDMETLFNEIAESERTSTIGKKFKVHLNMLKSIYLKVS